MEYNLTFQDVLQKTLSEGNKGMFQGEQFKRGVFLKLVENSDYIMLYEFKDKDDFSPKMPGTIVLSRGLFSQKYREVFNRQGLFKA